MRPMWGAFARLLFSLHVRDSECFQVFGLNERGEVIAKTSESLRTHSIFFFRRRSAWQRLEERGFNLPSLVKPEGSGYMPLYFAAQWIATRGGTLEIDPREFHAGFRAELWPPPARGAAAQPSAKRGLSELRH
jgi:hypothetical protein